MTVSPEAPTPDPAAAPDEEPDSSPDTLPGDLPQGPQETNPDADEQPEVPLDSGRDVPGARV